jgi:DNA-binding IclR family transcriptional regulator
MTSSLVEVARPVLEQITAETGESAQLWVRRGDVRVVVATVDSRQELRIALPTGTQLPLGAGGSAAAVLSGATDGSAGNGETPGWVESVSQRTPGIGSVSAPVRQHGEVVAAVCIPAPLPRVPSPGAAHGERVLAAAQQIERALRG